MNTKHNELERTRLDCDREASHNLNRLLDKPGLIKVVVKSGKIVLDKGLCIRYLENIFFGRSYDENQKVEESVFLFDFHSKDCSLK